LTELARLGIDANGPEARPQGKVSGRVGRLPGGAEGEVETGLTSGLRQAPRQRRLADAGLTDQHHHATRSLAGPLELDGQSPLLVHAADELARLLTQRHGQLAWPTQTFWAMPTDRKKGRSDGNCSTSAASSPGMGISLARFMRSIPAFMALVLG